MAYPGLPTSDTRNVVATGANHLDITYSAAGTSAMATAMKEMGVR